MILAWPDAGVSASISGRVAALPLLEPGQPGSHPIQESTTLTLEHQ